jgi:hypothetical protein
MCCITDRACLCHNLNQTKTKSKLEHPHRAMPCDRVSITCLINNVSRVVVTPPTASFTYTRIYYIMADMDVDVDMPAVTSKKDNSKKRFEVKKVCTIPHKILHVHSPAFSGMQWPCGHGVSSFIFKLGLIEVISADIVVDNCAICRNHIMDLCL